MNSLQRSEVFVPRGQPLPFDDIIHHLAGGVYCKETRIEAGKILVQHKHSYDHLSVLSKGSVIVDVDGKQTRFIAPAVLTIKAGVHHGVRALEDSVWLCIHASDVADDDAFIADPSDIDGAADVLKRLGA